VRAIDVEGDPDAAEQGFGVAILALEEGGVLFATSAALFEEITINEGRVAKTNFLDRLFTCTPQLRSSSLSGGGWGGGRCWPGSDLPMSVDIPPSSICAYGRAAITFS